MFRCLDPVGWWGISQIVLVVNADHLPDPSAYFRGWSKAEPRAVLKHANRYALSIAPSTITDEPAYHTTFGER